MGCGRIAPKHADTITQHLKDRARLVAVCDPKIERAKKFGEKYDVPYFSDVHEMMAKMKSEIDVISILTPSGYHAQNAFDVIKYKKHLVVEKPMALTMVDADKMISECDQMGVKLFVVKQNRLNKPVQKLRQAIESGRFGKLVLGTIRVRWCRDQKYYDQDGWRGTWKDDGGVFSNQAIHHVDLLQWIMGEVESVYAKATTALVNIEAEDTGVVVLKFKNGALGVIEATTATRPKDLEGSISVLGEKGTVEIGGFAVNEMKTWNFIDHSPEDDHVLETCKQKPGDVYGFGHIEFLSNVIHSIQDNRNALVDGLEGRKSLQLVTAIYESIETGKEVFINFTPQRCRLGLDSNEK